MPGGSLISPAAAQASTAGTFGAAATGSPISGGAACIELNGEIIPLSLEGMKQARRALALEPDEK